ncbi:hypothetical protein BAZOLSSOX_955 [uncultured Gammaproteobacteria bacterium]|nr:hypothetical protein BAZOLSSOX_2270 [uncultured Gammaproteobacteria bacterium]VVH61021.1 hypothetical protein BAZOLSSOX_955 [uncultured Gammaproteobacteria bacterium]
MVVVVNWLGEKSMMIRHVENERSVCEIKEQHQMPLRIMYAASQVIDI